MTCGTRGFKPAPLLGAALLVFGSTASAFRPLWGQGVTTAAMSGVVAAKDGTPLADATIVAVHVPSGTQYRAVTRTGGAYNVPNMRVGGPYRVTATRIGYKSHAQEGVFLSLGQDLRVDFALEPQAIELEAVEAAGQRDPVLNPGRTGAATFIDPEKVALLPSVKRSTRDLIRVDPRNDGNYSFAGRNWLYNNISLDGSYFNNPFGLDDPAPGGQTNAEPVPYDAVAEVQVSVAPFDVRQGGFTGANVNPVTKSGTNEYHASAYTFGRNQDLLGNTVRGSPVIANPDLGFIQAGASVSGALVHDKLFFFVNGEIERSHEPGSNFMACTVCTGTLPLGVSRVSADTLDKIRNRMITNYGYDPGPYQGYLHHTDNDKLIAKLDWNVNASNTLTFRWDYLKAKQDLPPHPFVLSFNNTGRGPNQTSLPFANSGYAINNHLHSFALELNSRTRGFANRFFSSYNRFRDFRQPFSEDFPTIEIGEAGVTYTTLGHEPFSIHNILDQDVWQFTDNVSVFRGKHVVTIGANLESFSFYNSFNLFRNGVFLAPEPFGTTFNSLNEFFQATDPTNPNQIKFQSYIGTGPYKGEDVHVGQVGFYVQDEMPASDRLNLTYGLRVDFPVYFTKPIDNPFSRSLTALDQNRQPVTVDESRLPGATPLFAPRVGFNWNAAGDRRTQVRGGTGIFTGRVPFVWIGNVISNPGADTLLYPKGPLRPSGSPQDSSTLAQSFDVNAVAPNFKWPQVWTTDLAIDQELGGGLLGTLEVIYGKDIHAIVMRNADLVAPVRSLPAPDGRPYFGGAGNNSLNPSFGGAGAGIYVLDNTSAGHSLNITAQLRKNFPFGLGATLGYSFTDARNTLKSTEIASVLWQNEPVKGDPNNPELGYSEFGARHRIVGSATYTKSWSPTLKTRIGLFLEAAQGNRFAGAGGNRYSFIYSGDVNGDGQAGNDLIYIPRSQSEIQLDPCPSGCGANVTAAQQWAALNAFISQDSYLKSHRGQIADRFGEANPWYNDVDLRILQEFAIQTGAQRHGFELSLDILNVGHLLNSSWGVRKVASAAATSPLKLVRFDATGAPVFNFTGPATTFIDDPSLLSRWQMQIGLRYLLN